MKFMFKTYIPGLILFLVISGQTGAQGVLKKVLFLGNSYTYFNNLPGMTAALAWSAGDSLYFESNTPGGYTLGWQPIAHATDPVSLAKISEGGWDFVVLQEQSQTPAIPALRDSCMYPAAIMLNDSVVAADSCAEVMLFLTWGRQTGGIQCFTPNYCSPNFTGFAHMQDSLSLAYKRLSDSLLCPVAPAGEAWRHVIQQYGWVLHENDESHPNLKGSYLTACVFYHCIFHKPASGLTFTAGLSPDTALLLQQAADTIVMSYSSLWNLWLSEPSADFAYTLQGNVMTTSNQSHNATHWQWNFGDGATSQEFEPVHEYAGPGKYQVTLTACNDCQCDTSVREVTIGTTGLQLPGNDEVDIHLISAPGSSALNFTGFSGNGRVTIYAANGQEVITSRVSQGSCRASGLAAGCYFWVLHDMNQQVISKSRLIIMP